MYSRKSGVWVLLTEEVVLFAVMGKGIVLTAGFPILHGNTLRKWQRRHLEELKAIPKDQGMTTHCDGAAKDGVITWNSAATWCSIHGRVGREQSQQGRVHRSNGIVSGCPQ